MATAVIHGETHVSEKDKQALMERDLSRFGAVFIESPSKDYFARDLTVGYVLFAIGHLVFATVFGRFYVSKEEFREKAAQQDIILYEIDADIHETFELVPYWKRVLLLIISPIGALFLFGIFVAGIRWTIGAVFYGGAQIIVALLGLLFFGFVWAVEYFALIEKDVMTDRDDIMAAEVHQISQEEGYEEVLINCGDDHRPGIASYLTDQGWTVEESSTKSWIGKLLNIPSRSLAAILHPRQSVYRAWILLRTFLS